MQWSYDTFPGDTCWLRIQKESLGMLEVRRERCKGCDRGLRCVSCDLIPASNFLHQDDPAGPVV